MNTLTGIAIYDPRRLSEEAFLANFVARTELVDFLLDLLRGTTEEEVGPHRNIIGQRGMGKTSLLRRLAIGISADPDLSARYIPLTFREEQYNVRSLDRFWRNCGEALAEWCEANDRQSLAERLDAEMDTPMWRDQQEAAKALLSVTQEIDRRPVLLVDNFDLILDALPEDEQWALRGVLQQRGGPVLYCASVRYLERTADRQAAFYEFFHLHHLNPLTLDELIACMRRLANSRGPAGEIVQRIMEREPERLKTLHVLTGGNPRVLALLYQLLERVETETVFADLEALLDQLTPFYKARIEDYSSDLQRAIIDAIALNWDPISAAEIAKETAIKATTLPAQLRRLANDGIVEEVKTSAGRSAFQLSERFFNIWYLMRHGTRRARQRVRWLTAFLKTFYRLEELRRLQNAAISSRSSKPWHSMFCEAIDVAIELSGADLRDDIIRRIIEAERSGALSERPSEAEARTLTEASPNSASAWAALAFTEFVYDHYEDARRSAEKALSIQPDEKMAMTVLGTVLQSTKHYKEADACWSRLMLTEKSNAPLFLMRATLLADNLGEIDAAIDLLRRAVDIDPQYNSAWVKLGSILETAGRFEEAEPALLRARENDPSSLIVEAELGILMWRQERLSAAEGHFSRALEISPDAGPIWYALGLVQLGLGREHDAEQAFRTAIDHGEETASVLVKLAGLVSHRDPAQAEELARKAVSTSPGSSDAWVFLGNNLSDHQHRLIEAESIYRSALEQLPGDAFISSNLAWLLLRLGRIEDARDLRKQVSIDDVALHLLDAAISLTSDEREEAYRHLAAALDSGLELPHASFFDDFLRVLRIAAERGDGDALLEWLEANGHADEQRPVHVGYLAYLKGEQHLRDVNPEVRAPAEKIYRWFARGGERRSPQVDETVRQ